MTLSTMFSQKWEKLHTVKKSNDSKFYIFKKISIETEGKHIFKAVQHGSEKSCW